MATQGCPGNMAEVVNAAVQEYVHVMVREDGAPGQVVVVQEGGGGDVLSPEILQSISHSDTIYYVQPDGSLVPGGRLLNGGRVLEAAHPEVRLEAAVVETAIMESMHPEVRLEAGGHVMEAAVLQTAIMEAAHPDVRLEAGGHVMETAVMQTGMMEAAHPEVRLEAGGCVMEATVMQTPIMEAAHPEVRMEAGGRVMEAAVVQTAIMEATHPGMILVGAPGLVNGDQTEEEEDSAMESALNLTMEATDRRREATTTPAGTQNMAAQRMVVPQLQTVAHPVALREVAPSIPGSKLNPIHVQIPGLQSKQSADPVVLNLSGVHVKFAGAALPGSQVVHIKSLSDSGQPLMVNTSTLESPIQILVRSAPLSAAKPRTPDLNRNSGELAVVHAQNGARTLADHAQNKGHKRKKTIKIKTRSGRISRPPKHKAKDYKFLKVGDLIQDNASDSEDYSELSTDEEEKPAKEKAPCDLPPITVKNALFQCQTCEKSYMGKGGLSRHYRLYPSHGQMEPPYESDVKKNGKAGAGGNSLPGEPKKPIARPGKRLLVDPLNPAHSNLPTLDIDGLEFASVSTSSQRRRQITGRRYGRPRKTVAIASSEQNALAAKQLLQQCDDADIREHVVPSLSERLSVGDFSLVKVKRQHPEEPLFPHLYKELEKLHCMVRQLAAEYFSNAGAGKTLEVTDSKVAASLDISAEQIVEISPLPEEISDERIIVFEDETNECSIEEMMPPSKRSKVDEPESENATTAEMTTEATVYIQEEQTPDVVTDEVICGTDASSDVTINCTVQVCDISHPIVEDGGRDLSMITDPASVPCDIEEEVMAAPLLGGESGSSVPVSTERSVEAPDNDFRSHVPQEEMKPDEAPLPCPPADFTLPSDALPPSTAEKICSDGFQCVEAFIPPDTDAGDPCTQAFGFHHGQDLVFIQDSEAAAVGEAGVIYEPPACPQRDTVAALMEMK
ncbi:zinc finger protein 839 [Anomaloglossus baeobatrachus]|uniref:zinc finger protein 839 n=1 Tax=Anomaloglossus baeobatrachus TaxID=238106 RepID=UPI003F500C40